MTGCGSAWLERLVWDQEVAGSNPIRVVYPQGYILISEYGILAQLGEHLPYKQRVTGSSPVGPIVTNVLCRCGSIGRAADL